MSGHFEDSHNSENPEHLAHCFDRVQLVDQGRQVVRKNGQQVNDVHEALDKLAVVRTGQKSHNELYREPSHVDGLKNIYHRVGVCKQRISNKLIFMFSCKERLNY